MSNTCNKVEGVSVSLKMTPKKLIWLRSQQFYFGVSSSISESAMESAVHFLPHNTCTSCRSSISFSLHGFGAFRQKIKYQSLMVYVLWSHQTCPELWERDWRANECFTDVRKRQMPPANFFCWVLGRFWMQIIRFTDSRKRQMPLANFLLLGLGASG